MNNKEISDKLREIASLLEEQGANTFRANAYRRAANTVDGLTKPMNEIVDQLGISGLTDLPGIGVGIARSIYEYVVTGHMSRLESLKSGHDPVQLFETIPGVGPTLAHRLIEVLHIDTLEALELAAYNGRLAQVPGFSEKKIALVQLWLRDVLGGYRRSGTTVQGSIEEPTVSLLLQVDFLYRKKAHADELPKIAPKRFNPTGKAWLPILHVSRKDWHFTALYSNTERAHALGMIEDWVVIFFYDKQHHEGQHTVVTETKGALLGKRVVRGREEECRIHYFGK